MTEVALKVYGIYYKPCYVIQKSKRKTLVRYKNGAEEWVENKFLVPVDDNDFALKAKILRWLR